MSWEKAWIVTCNVYEKYIGNDKIFVEGGMVNYNLARIVRSKSTLSTQSQIVGYWLFTMIVSLWKQT